MNKTGILRTLVITTGILAFISVFYGLARAATLTDLRLNDLAKKKTPTAPKVQSIKTNTATTVRTNAGQVRIKSVEQSQTIRRTLNPAPAVGRSPAAGVKASISKPLAPSVTSKALPAYKNPAAAKPVQMTPELINNPTARQSNRANTEINRPITPANRPDNTRPVSLISRILFGTPRP